MAVAEHVAFLSLGSNLGDRARLLQSAILALAGDPRLRINLAQDVASLYETTPVGGPTGQARFLNTAVRAVCNCPPIELLRLAMSVECSLGRVRSQQWGPRAIDVDLLLLGDHIVESDELTLPHPRLHRRRFVLEPLAEISGNVLHPRLGVTIAQLAQRARVEPTDEDVVRVAGPEWVQGDR